VKPRLTIVVMLAVAALTGIALAAPRATEPTARATASTAQVSGPGLVGTSSGVLAAPPAASGGGAFAYPEDGSILRVGAASASVVAQPGISSSAQGVVDALAVSVFAGEITADSVNVRASAAAGPAGATGDVSSSAITGLIVLGAPVTPSVDAQVPLADWGTLELLSTTTDTRSDPEPTAESTVIGLRIRLLADHGGLPEGAEILVASVTARSVAEPVVEPPTAEKPSPNVPTTPKPAVKPRPKPNAPREPGESIPGAPPELVRTAPEVTARLTQGGYVFPVYGPAGFGDTFGASRPNVAGGWHHGEDIVAPLGTPLLAVADGTLFSVGWNDIGGWRLWLRDLAGNEFYYAHLSAYSPLAVEGRRVKAGDVIGFVGKSGDAEASIPHLHFEIHPVSLLALGYDGAVAPYPFLNAWRRADDVSFGSGRQFIRDGLPVAAPRAGAVLLEASDISAASGLVPGALERELRGGP
jgi:murein DD-endopeptidase MepM/ murein hydrolase activator NlpD